MKIQAYLDEIKFQLTGGVLHLELKDEQLLFALNMAFREICTYIDETKMVTVPFASCIDLKDWKYDTITNVFRVRGTNGVGPDGDNDVIDPMYMQQWMVFSNGGTMYNLNDYLMNFLSWSTLSQMKNTISTDMAFREDKHDKKLYINESYDKPSRVTIEYIPLFESVEEIESQHWINLTIRLAVAQTKVVLGRLRTRFTQSNALYTMDGERMLEEGNKELDAIREELNTNNIIIGGLE